jgi:hypothetical protein
LNDKYQYVYLYGLDTDEVRRIIHVEWSIAVLTQLVNQKQGEEEDVVSYHINDSLYECIRAAPHPYTHIINSEDWLIQVETN